MEVNSPVEPDRTDEQNRLGQLHAAAGAGPVLILTHDNPDPDALASGAALAALLRAVWGIPSRSLYTGIVARAENRAVLRHLTPEWEHADTLDGLAGYSAIALVDTQPWAGNNCISADCVPQIVIDHHQPLRDVLDKVRFVDVRTDAAATVSIIYQYFQTAHLVPDAILATAMFYGLHTDTRGLSRSASASDESVYLDLLARLDRARLVQVEQAGLPRAYFHALARGLQSARICGQSVAVNLGTMHRPDLMAEMADLLIRLDGTRAVLCLGQYEQTLHLSLRTVALGQDAGLLVQEIVHPLGKGGGHGLMAGGQIPLDGQDIAALVAEIEARFLKVLGETDQCFPLIPEDPGLQGQPGT